MSGLCAPQNGQSTPNLMSAMMRKIKICRVDVCIVSIDDALKKGKTFFFLFFLFFRDFSEFA